MSTHSTAIDEVHRRIGRNLLRFQEIEVGLKLILPYVHPDAGAKGIDALKSYRQQRVTSQTLGPLLAELEASISASPNVFASSLDNLRKARNDLVHHFYELPEVDLLHPDGAAQAITVQLPIECYKQPIRVWAFATEKGAIVCYSAIGIPLESAKFARRMDELEHALAGAFSVVSAMSFAVVRCPQPPSFRGRGA